MQPPTPATGYQLPAPPQFPPPAASRAELRDQVAALLTGDDESRRRAVDFAAEIDGSDASMGESDADADMDSDAGHD